MIKINLIKPERKEIDIGKDAAELPIVAAEEKKTGIRPGAIAAALVLSLAFIALAYVMQARNLKQTTRDLGEKRQIKASLEEVIQALDDLEKAEKTLNRRVELIKGLNFKRKSAAIVMQEVSKALPDWLWLTVLDFKDNDIRLNGRALSINIVADFIKNLEQSPFIESAALESSSRRSGSGQDLWQFRVDCVYREIPGKEK